jgi:hypothetical protein
MNRNEARRIVERNTYLHTAEKAALYDLLLRADNWDCAIPDQYSPKMPELARGVALKSRAVQYLLRHLDLHGWLTVKPGRGRGHKSTYVLLPRTPDDACRCEKAQASAAFGSRKGATNDTKKVQSASALSQVDPSSAQKAMKGRKVKGTADDDQPSDGETLAGEPKVVPFTRRIGHRTPPPDWSRWPEDTQGAMLRGRQP